MLVLSRKKNESIRIRDDVTVTVVSIHGDKVRLGIEAPREVPILRDDARRREPHDSGRIVSATGKTSAGAGGRQDR